jgi:hypothetical protein
MKISAASEFRMANIPVFTMAENHAHKCKLEYKDMTFIPSFVDIRVMFKKLSKGTDTHGHYNAARITLFIEQKENSEKTLFYFSFHTEIV